MEIAQLSQQLADIVAAVSPSVVRVATGDRGAVTGIAWSHDIALCADHSLDGDARVVHADGTRLEAELVGRDPALDLAVLRTAGAGLVPPPWIDLEGVRVGNLVLAISRPGQLARANVGVVSVLGDAWRTWMGGRVERMLQSDVRLHPGFSGSLLIDVEGRALGFNTARLRRGVAVALPAATLQRAIERILAPGGARRGFLGIGAMPVRLPSPLAARAAGDRALLVVSVQPGSAAEAAGILLGDVVVALGARTVASLPDLLDALEDTAAGDRRSVRILRGGEPHDVDVTLGARAA
jgi:S1-C subfamily serine protease